MNAIPTPASSASPLMSRVDDRTRLAGSNRMELLLFSLGGREVFGINVFKVREVCEAMPVTRTPNVPHGVEGLVSLRGAILPVIHLARAMSLPEAPAAKIIVTEFSGRSQAFLVADVDRIVRVDWENVHSPQAMVVGEHSTITAITELPDGRLVSILDVEQILAQVSGAEPPVRLQPLEAERSNAVFFADDSSVARRRISEVLEQLHLPYQFAINGREAWDRLQALAAGAAAVGRPLSASLGLVLVDAEMPEMDGYVLTRHIKADGRFRGIPVVMHSSLSSEANRKLGQKVGVDAYVAKFHADELGREIAARIAAREVA